MASPSSIWKDEEVYKLIELWGDDVIQSQLEGCKHNREVYEKISKSMKEAGYNKSSDQCRDKAKKLKADYRKTKDKNKETGNKRKTCKYQEALEEVLGHRPATKPPLVIDTSSAGIYDTDGEGNAKNGCNDRPADFRADDIGTSDDTVSIATTDVSSAPTDVSSEGIAKVEVKAVKKVLKKRGREDRLQTIMSGIVTQILDSQVQSDERYLELEEKRMRLDQENKEREERMRKDEMNFQLRMMSMLVQSQSTGYPCPPYNGSFYGSDSSQ